MKLIRILLLVCVTLLSAQFSKAQDIHFSQFYMAPLDLNPAMTGVMNCDMRFVANYRNQWASILKENAYSTFMASFDQRVAVGRYDYFGIGANLWTDRAGETNFSTFNGNVSVAYSKRMGGSARKKESHYLVVGAEAGLGQRRIDFGLARWGTQQTELGVFNPGVAPEIWNLENFLFGDISAGMLWFSMIKDHNFYVGAALNHLNRANQSFSQDLFEALYTKFTFHAGGELSLNERIAIVPNLVMFKQGPSFQFNGGANGKFTVGKSRFDEQSFQIGGYVRLANNYKRTITMDALILMARFDYNNMGLGFSYDLNVSSLRPATNANGSFEFSLIYKICGPDRRRVYCPGF